MGFQLVQVPPREELTIPCRVTAHGEKLHPDQNEEVVMYGKTHVVAVDGYLLDAIAIYDCLF